MLTAFLREHPMRELLKGGTRKLYPPAENRQAWEKIPEVYLFINPVSHTNVMLNHSFHYYL